MILNIKKNLDDAIIPDALDSNSIEFKCAQIGTGIGKDGRLVIEYRAGLSVEIPEGYIGILSPLDNAYIDSLLMPSSIVTMTPGWNEIVARFKTNTDSVPSIYEQGNLFAKLVIVQSSSFSFNEIEVEEKTDNNEEQIQEETMA